MWSRLFLQCSRISTLARTDGYWSVLQTATRNATPSRCHVMTAPNSRDELFLSRTTEQFHPVATNLPLDVLFTPYSITIATATPTSITTVTKECPMEQCGIEEVEMSSVLKKRRKKMNKHKYKKWRKKHRFLRRRLGK